MSTTYHLACLECKRELWVGQGDRCFYSGEPDTMNLLRDFLWDHEEHHLEFGPDNKFLNDDYTSVYFENKDRKKLEDKK